MTTLGVGLTALYAQQTEEDFSRMWKRLRDGDKPSPLAELFLAVNAMENGEKMAKVEIEMFADRRQK